MYDFFEQREHSSVLPTGAHGLLRKKQNQTNRRQCENEDTKRRHNRFTRFTTINVKMIGTAKSIDRQVDIERTGGRNSKSFDRFCKPAEGTEREGGTTQPHFGQWSQINGGDGGRRPSSATGRIRRRFRVGLYLHLRTWHNRRTLGRPSIGRAFRTRMRVSSAFGQRNLLRFEPIAFELFGIFFVSFETDLINFRHDPIVRVVINFNSRTRFHVSPPRRFNENDRIGFAFAVEFFERNFRIFRNEFKFFEPFPVRFVRFGFNGFRNFDPQRRHNFSRSNRGFLRFFIVIEPPSRKTATFDFLTKALGRFCGSFRTFLRRRRWRSLHFRRFGGTTFSGLTSNTLSDHRRISNFSVDRARTTFSTPRNVDHPRRMLPVFPNDFATALFPGYVCVRSFSRGMFSTLPFDDKHGNRQRERTLVQVTRPGSSHTLVPAGYGRNL